MTGHDEPSGPNAPFSLISGGPNAATGPAGVVLTIGHSNRALDHFIEIVRDADIEIIVDIRAFPRSRTNPQFNIETLPGHLAHYQIGYEHWPELGGRRARQASIAPGANAFWHNRIAKASSVLAILS